MKKFWLNLIEMLMGHRHYYGIWHKCEDCRLKQTCYECGKERELKIEL